VVAADMPANRAVLTPDNAVITRPTPEALADGILKLCQTPRLADELGRRGRNTLREDNRTPEAFRTSLQHCYDYVTARSEA
jgi:glycosyltransferase involved in cell wall biosynthesis